MADPHDSANDRIERKRTRHRDYMRAYYHKNREKWLARLAAKRAANPGEDARKRREWRENNLERWRARKRAYDAENRDKVRKQKNEWNALHRDAQKRRSATWYARNANRMSEKQRAKRLQNPKVSQATSRAQYAKHREKRLMANWKKTIANQEKRAGRQKPKACEICEETKRICFDHSHTNGMFRGWICHRCNTLLGLADDDAALLRKLAEYLDQHGATKLKRERSTIPTDAGAQTRREQRLHHQEPHYQWSLPL